MYALRYNIACKGTSYVMHVYDVQKVHRKEQGNWYYRFSLQLSKPYAKVLQADNGHMRTVKNEKGWRHLCLVKVCVQDDLGPMAFEDEMTSHDDHQMVEMMMDTKTVIIPKMRLLCPSILLILSESVFSLYLILFVV